MTDRPAPPETIARRRRTKQAGPPDVTPAAARIARDLADAKRRRQLADEAAREARCFGDDDWWR